MDYFGNFVENSYAAFEKLLWQKRAEYIDLLCYSQKSHEIERMGFDIRGPGDIIPNYFEPFIRQNIEIYAFYRSKTYTIFKADSDQDRPNIKEGSCKKKFKI